MKNVKESKCCQKCGLITNGLKVVKDWSGYLSVCTDCFDDMEAEKLYKAKVFDYISKKHKIKTLTPCIINQIRQLHEQGYSHKQLLYICYYTYEVAKNYKPQFYYTVANMIYSLRDAISYADANNIDIDKIIEEIDNNGK